MFSNASQKQPTTYGGIDLTASESVLETRVHEVFDGLIPEGWLLDIAVDHWKVKINDRFQLLLHSCRDTIGAVTVIPVEEGEIN